MIEKVIIKNFKSIESLSLNVDEDINIIVGDNEQGKSTILEAINLALTAYLNKRSIHNEISPFIFNRKTVNTYLNFLRDEKTVEPPKILIEVYFQENETVASLKGTNNSLKEDTWGISLSIELDEEFTEEYKEYIKNPNDINNIPIEYYTVKWYSFAFSPLTSRSNPVKCVLIDATEGKAWNGTERYISSIIGNTLDLKQRVALNVNYRDLKESFSSIDAIKDINTSLSSKTGEISDKGLSISLDVSQKSGWESHLTAYLDDIPFDLIGKGEQNSIKLKLSLETNLEDVHVILIEEPETHLSYTNMSKLVKQISEKCVGKQLLITTHSTYVLNKLGLDHVIFLNEGNTMTLKDLDEDTYNYFKKLPGYDTLRLILSEKAILVEGPSDELIVQKAYSQKYGRLPIEDGVDVITIRGLSFKRYLEIADKLSKNVSIITDNDGDIEKNITKKYGERYLNHPSISINYGIDENYRTLEPQLVKVNGVDFLNKILDVDYSTEEALIKYMTSPSKKSECAMQLFDSDEILKIPEYIENAIQ
ncbi:ATP-dependent endonuclease [Sporosarcina sp. P1]|uniref:ATP-dependent nuclease n=1 Tax=Sporosarcina sp. P1 TaxID=2048257 RepID=UPI000C172AF4|nr:AAA family ATPase [Sporosarcina sp. P1]PIC83609.1 ATP-dependent endonuclease [Sporosarcina sp. P1]